MFRTLHLTYRYGMRRREVKLDTPKTRRKHMSVGRRTRHSNKNRSRLFSLQGIHARYVTRSGEDDANRKSNGIDRKLEDLRGGRPCSCNPKVTATGGLLRVAGVNARGRTP